MSKNGTVDYSKGLIYKLCCKDPNITGIYIGSTTNMRNRKNQHKNGCNNSNNNNFNLKVYKTIREFGGWDNWDMILVEYVNCNSKIELEKEERIVIELLKPTLNMKIPTRTDKEYYEENKEKILEYHKIYSEENKEKILEYQKKYRKNNKEKSKETFKNYYIDNKEKLLEKDKKYYQKNKEQIKEKTKVKVKCEFCENLIRKYGLKRHQETISCKKFQLIDN